MKPTSQGIEISIPSDLDEDDRRAYLRGLEDGMRYFENVAAQARAMYEVETRETEEEEEKTTDTCPSCGEDMHYNPASGNHWCDCS